MKLQSIHLINVQTVSDSKCKFLISMHCTTALHFQLCLLWWSHLMKLQLCLPLTEHWFGISMHPTEALRFKVSLFWPHRVSLLLRFCLLLSLRDLQNPVPSTNSDQHKKEHTSAYWYSCTTKRLHNQPISVTSSWMHCCACLQISNNANLWQCRSQTMLISDNAKLRRCWSLT